MWYQEHLSPGSQCVSCSAEHQMEASVVFRCGPRSKRHHTDIVYSLIFNVCVVSVASVG